jgi:TPR repeat protein
VKWYRKGSEKGNADAQVNLGRMYERGKGGLKVDRGAARLWYRKASQQGDKEGRNRLDQLSIQGQ